MSQGVYRNRLPSEKAVDIKKVAMVQWTTESKYDEDNSKTNLEYIIQIPYNSTTQFLNHLTSLNHLLLLNHLILDLLVLPCAVW
jgi:hypothetical protein